MYKLIKKSFIFIFIIIFAYLLLKDETFDEKTLVIGSSIPYSGSIDLWGEAVNNGVNSYFNYANEFNLLKDKKIKFLAYDDKYEPELTYENIEKLIHKNNVFALFGFVGTPTIKRVLPVIYDENIPFFAPFSGASFLRNNSDNIINFRSSYKEEIENLVNYLESQNKLERVAIFYQNDIYGEENYISLKNALKEKNRQLFAEGSYNRNTLSISHAFNEIKDVKPQVIFISGAYKANSLFIQKAKEDEELKDVIFCNISFGDANSMVKELKNLNTDTKNIIFSQVVPNYENQNLKIANEYQMVMKKYFNDKPLGFLSFEAFLSSKVLVNAISRIDGKITRDKLIFALKTTPSDLLEGIHLEYKNSQLLNQTYLFKYENEHFIELEK
ncbi:ABC transporter substrate-binding protein [Aliarcobacter butzleri]|uniref:ABC transporter substrate-binding protein n=1 Tax=Aliarcobacter butzleri TaxID=28197 RepID=UPI0021B374DD|nr:ABC transporter substrate-binding protein [Aliarcobacter butzleri]MCT7562145.1 ABC transporter substrate-binding protein [Aliarcobacter butzleri]UWY59515.1 ABC transporter substrate-binding protein [Aliarcobacter butzleri]